MRTVVTNSGSHAAQYALELVSGILALVIVGGAVLIAVAQALSPRESMGVPPWLAGAVGVVVGYYFSRTVAVAVRNGHNGHNGMETGQHG